MHILMQVVVNIHISLSAHAYLQSRSYTLSNLHSPLNPFITYFCVFFIHSFCLCKKAKKKTPFYNKENTNESL